MKTPSVRDGLSIRDFVRLSLVEIVQGVADAQKESAGSGALISPSMQGGARLVSFDIAVTADRGEASRGGAKVRVAGFLSGGGEGESSQATSTVSRIQFGVYVTLPRADWRVNTAP